VLAQLARPGIRTFHFWSPLASNGHQDRTKGSLQHEFLPVAFGSFRKGREHFKTPGKMAARLNVR
jgi:hypothetical protein